METLYLHLHICRWPFGDYLACSLQGKMMRYDWKEEATEDYLLIIKEKTRKTNVDNKVNVIP